LRDQLYIFFIFILNGFLIGILFDVFRILRKSFKTPDIITYIQDIIFWILTGFVILFSIFKFSNGELRNYVFLGLLFGILIYFLIFSKIFVKISVNILKIVKKIIKVIIITPIGYILIFLRKILFKPISFICINLKKARLLFKNGINWIKKPKKVAK